ncbi:MAG: pyridoxal phosphate-dependent aminotransferase [Desulfitobacteriaceae bacterium]
MHQQESRRKLGDMGIDTIQELAKSLSDVIYLESGDTNLTPELHIVEATKEAVGKVEYNTYVPFQGLPVLRNAVSQRMQEDYGLSYDPETEIVITAGGTEGMLDALLATVGPGDDVLMFDPVYTGMMNRVRLTGATPVLAPLVEARGWHMDLAAIESKLSVKTKAIFFVSPNSPTGTVFNRQELEFLAKLAKERNLVVIYNAVFDKIVFDGEIQFNIATLPDMRERTLIVGSVSKNYGMSGWRVGWVAGPKNLMAEVSRIHTSNTAVASPASQVGAAVALTGPQEWIKERVLVFKNRQNAILNILKEAEPYLISVQAEGGWTFLVDHRPVTPSSYEFAEFLLKEARVAVTPMKDWGTGLGEGHVRIVFAKNEEAELQEAAYRIVEAVNRVDFHP